MNRKRAVELSARDIADVIEALDVQLDYARDEHLQALRESREAPAVARTARYMRRINRLIDRLALVARNKRTTQRKPA